MASYTDDDAIMSDMDAEKLYSSLSLLMDGAQETSNVSAQNNRSNDKDCSNCHAELQVMAQAALVEKHVDLNEHGKMVLSNATPSQLAEFVPQNVLDRVIVERLEDAPIHDVVMWLAKAGRLGYHVNDIVNEEDESVTPYLSTAIPSQSEDVAMDDTAVATQDLGLLPNGNHQLPNIRHPLPNSRLQPNQQGNKDGDMFSGGQTKSNPRYVQGVRKHSIKITMDSDGKEMMKCTTDRAWKLLSAFQPADAATGKMRTTCKKCQARSKRNNRSKKN